MKLDRNRRTVLIGVLSFGLLIAGAIFVSPQPSARTVHGTTRTAVHGGGAVHNGGAAVHQGGAVHHSSVAVHRDIDVDVDHDYHPVARVAGTAAAVAVTAAVVGSVVYSLPPSCSAVAVGGVTYQQCGSSWYQPQYAGSQINYVVVNPPQ